MFYQYLSSDHAILNLERKVIKVSRIKNINDIFELQPYRRFERGTRKLFQAKRNQIHNEYGMVCFSSSWVEPVMWGHYADKCKGIVLGFEINSTRFGIQEVKYPKEPIRIEESEIVKMTSQEFIDKVGFSKYKSWSYENEFRFFISLNECVQINGIYFLPFSADLTPTQIIIGPANSTFKNGDFVNSTKHLINLVKGLSLEIKVARLEFGGFRIIKCGKWTPKFQALLT